jgi:hypothetical protein
MARPVQVASVQTPGRRDFPIADLAVIEDVPGQGAVSSTPWLDVGYSSQESWAPLWALGTDSLRRHRSGVPHLEKRQGRNGRTGGLETPLRPRCPFHWNDYSFLPKHGDNSRNSLGEKMFGELLQRNRPYG